MKRCFVFLDERPDAGIGRHGTLDQQRPLVQSRVCRRSSVRHSRASLTSAKRALQRLFVILQGVCVALSRAVSSASKLSFGASASARASGICNLEAAT